MAIKVTGFFQNPTTGLIHQSPILTLVPHLVYPGGIALDVHIDNTGTVAYQSIDKSELVYDNSITNGHDQLLNALENYVINHLKSANEVNEFSTFEHYVKPVVEEVTTETEETIVEEDNSEETAPTDTPPSGE
jgi:hypothetical protein